MRERSSRGGWGLDDLHKWDKDPDKLQTEDPSQLHAVVCGKGIDRETGELIARAIFRHGAQVTVYLYDEHPEFPLMGKGSYLAGTMDGEKEGYPLSPLPMLPEEMVAGLESTVHVIQSGSEHFSYLWVRDPPGSWDYFFEFGPI